MGFGLKNMKLTIAFAVVALSPVLYGAGPVAAQTRGDLKPLTLTQIQDSQENRTRYGFAVPVLDEVAKDDLMRGSTQVSVGSLSDGNVKDLFFQRVEGPIHCGASSCDFVGFVKSGSGYREIIHISAGDEIYAQSCPGETSLIFVGDDGQAGKWTYQANGFELQGTYTGLDKVPACKMGN
jgi:hypothetical protein